MKVSEVILTALLLSLVKLTGANPAAYASCLIAKCGLSIATKKPVRCAKGVVKCAKFLLCYSDDTKVITPDGEVSVQNIHEGDKVMTLIHGKKEWTTVNSVGTTKVHVSGIKMKVRTASSTEVSVEVTDTHGIPHLNSSTLPKTEQSFSSNLEVVPASMISVGDKVQVLSSGMLVSADVISVENTLMHSKTFLNADEGTVLANNILTATSCGGVGKMSFQEFKDHVTASNKEKECYEELFENYNNTVKEADHNKTGDVYPADVWYFMADKCTRGSNEKELNAALRDKIPNSNALSVHASDDTATLLNMNLMNHGVKAAEAAQDNVFLCDECGKPITITDLEVI